MASAKNARMEDGKWKTARAYVAPFLNFHDPCRRVMRMLCISAAILAASSAVRGASGPTSGPFEQTTIRRRDAGPAPATQPRGATSGSAQTPWDTGKVPLALGGVLALILVMRWLGKKMVIGAGGRRRGTSRAVQVLVQSPLSARQQLMLVQVGRRLVLVGNSGSEMSALCQIKDPEEVAEVLTQVREEKTSVAKNFGALFGRAGKVYDAPEAAGVDRDTAADEQPEEVTGAAAEAAAEPATTEEMQEELTGLMERARRISKQFQGTT